MVSAYFRCMRDVIVIVNGVVMGLRGRVETSVCTVDIGLQCEQGVFRSCCSLCCQAWPSALPLLAVESCTVSFHAKPVLPIVSSLEIVGICCDIVQCVGCCLSFSWHSDSGVQAFCRMWIKQRDVVEQAIMQTSCQCCVWRTVSPCYCTVRVGVTCFSVPRDGRRKC
jgi:hypothetical protein